MRPNDDDSAPTYSREDFERDFNRFADSVSDFFG